MDWHRLLATLVGLIWAGSVPVASASRVFVADESGAIVEVDSGSGEQHMVAFGWREPTDFVIAPSGNLWVLDAGLLNTGGILEINTRTGRQSILALGDHLADPNGRVLVAMTLDTVGSLIVAKSSAGPLIKVDPTTGDQTELDAEVTGSRGLAVEPNGDLLVTAYESLFLHRLYRLDATTGQASVLSEGGLFAYLSDVVVAADGSIFVASTETPETFQFGSIVRVDPSSGDQTLVFEGGPLGNPVGLDLDSAGRLIVAHARGFQTGPGGISRINPVTGKRTTIASGGFLDYAVGIAVLDDQTYLVLVDQNGREKILTVDAVTGTVSVIYTGGTIGRPFDLVPDAAGNFLIVNGGEWGGENWTPRVDGSTGYQSYLAQGRIDDLVLEDADTLLVAEPGILSERNPQTGERTREISQISGPDAGQHIAREATGDLLLLTAGYFFCDHFNCYHEPARIIRVDRLSGGQTVLVEDDELIGARGIELDVAGDPWIIVDTQTGPSIVRIDLQSGQRQTVAQGGLLVEPSDLAFGGAGSLFVADRGAGALLEIDPETGEQSLVSQGGTLISPRGLLVVPEPSQTLLLCAAATVLGCLAHGRRAPSEVGRSGDVSVRRAA